MLIKANCSFLVEKTLKKYTDNFSFSGGMIWNTIPSDVREAESHTTFKSSYVQLYRQ